MGKRVYRFFVVVAAAVAALGAWLTGGRALAGAAPGASLAEPARAEGRLVWYTVSALQEAEQLLGVFKQRYPFIRTEVVKLTTAPMLERILTERARNQVVADVVDVSGDLALRTLVEAGALEAFTPPGLERWPAPYLRYQPYGFVYRILEGSVAYNVNRVSQAEATLLKSWKGVVDPRWRGRIAIVDPKLTGSWSEVFYALYTLYGEEWLRSLAELRPAKFNSNVPATEQVVRGEYDVALVTSHFPAGQYAHGAPVAIAYPSPTPTLVGYVGIAKGAPHPNAARLFLSWVLGEEGQQAWSRILQVPPALPGVADPREVTRAPWYEAPKERYFNDPDAFEANQERFLRVWERYFGR